ncbi:g7811 [Coccomyxa viridis]|uniref:G7811 protein n=1 Tax=Coccomyxa viridis TaxID=1274662 RepID=A0ABP1FYW0_9CHLO
MAFASTGSVLSPLVSPSRAFSTASITRLATPGLVPTYTGAVPDSVWTKMQHPSRRSATPGHSRSASGPELEAVDDGMTQLAVRAPQLAPVLLAAPVALCEGAGSSRAAGIAARSTAPRTPSDEQDRELVD